MPWWGWALAGGVVLFGAAGWLLGRWLQQLDQADEDQRPGRVTREI